MNYDDNYTCLARVACMVTGEPLQSLFDFLGHDGSDKVPGSSHPQGYRAFTIDEIDMYLESNNVWSFTPYSFEDITRAEHYSVFNRVFNGVCDRTLVAIVIVESDSVVKGGTHAMLWFAPHLICPKMGVVSLNDYEIIAWIPLVGEGIVDIKVCQQCEKQVAECMGDLCLMCDHLQGERK